MADRILQEDLIGHFTSLNHVLVHVILTKPTNYTRSLLICL